MKRPRSIHGSGADALMPTLTGALAEHPLIVSDLKVETVLYEALLAERRNNEVLRRALHEARERLNRWRAKGLAKKISYRFKPTEAR